ncbi:MAG: polynucleotide adenylyltransferase PcnB [Endozoicomonadaceae bacterium]|nr:polynucleotide adenylyltransferase PcnB [Endozoicomonadaceae bacterium]
MKDKRTGFIHRLFSYVVGKQSDTQPSASKLRILSRDQHTVSSRHISDNALKVLCRLNSHGYQAYLVGGCIRDLMLDLHPKDFDIATDATPEKIRSLFRNSRIIGRRFKLIHVVFGREVIEVATFRASHHAENDEHDSSVSHHSKKGRILRDNVYGTIEDDAFRRDFTINSLYYTISDSSIHDFCGGVQDMEDQLIRLIGDPVIRYREDPVRMLRAIRFAAKLNFQLADDTAAPISQLAHLLKDIPSARLFDESLKLFLSGGAENTYYLLRDYQLFDSLFPATHASLKDAPDRQQIIVNALRNTDLRIEADKPVTPAFFYAAMLWPALICLCERYEKDGVPPASALQQAATEVIAQQCKQTAIPRRFTIPLREIWEMQSRLERRQPRRIDELLSRPVFRAAYDFLLLREQSGEQASGAGQWWTDYQESSQDDEHQVLMEQLHSRSAPSDKRKRRRRRPRKRPGTTV